MNMLNLRKVAENLVKNIENVKAGDLVCVDQDWRVFVFATQHLTVENGIVVTLAQHFVDWEEREGRTTSVPVSKDVIMYELFVDNDDPTSVVAYTFFKEGVVEETISIKVDDAIKEVLDAAQIVLFDRYEAWKYHFEPRHGEPVYGTHEESWKNMHTFIQHTRGSAQTINNIVRVNIDNEASPPSVFSGKKLSDVYVQLRWNKGDANINMTIIVGETELSFNTNLVDFLVLRKRDLVDIFYAFSVYE